MTTSRITKEQVYKFAEAVGGEKLFSFGKDLGTGPRLISNVNNRTKFGGDRMRWAIAYLHGVAHANGMETPEEFQGLVKSAQEELPEGQYQEARELGLREAHWNAEL